MTSALVVLVGLVTVPLLAVFLGVLEVPVPYPATVEKFVELPDGSITTPREFEGPFAKNDLLTQSVLLVSNVSGSESATIAVDGSLYMLDKFANVQRAVYDASSGWKVEAEPVAYLGAGRPLGAHFDAQGNLIICDSIKGLLKLEAGTHAITFLATHMPVNGSSRPITYANDLDIASDGGVYFTSSQSILPGLNRDGYWDTLRSYMLGLFSGEHHGRLLRWSPLSRQVEVLTEGYWYTNGVALSADESFVAFVETNKLRVLRYWLKGSKVGTVDVLVDRLPGFPDGVDRASDGGFWVSLVAPLSPLYSKLSNKFLRMIAAYLPSQLLPPMKAWGCVAKVSVEGEITQVLMDSNGSTVSFVSSVLEYGGWLIMGNLRGTTIHAFNLAGATQQQHQPAADGVTPGEASSSATS